jgi:hypothetical protein
MSDIKHFESADPMEPQAQEFTTWHNPTNDLVIADVYVGDGAGRSRRRRYAFKPDEKKMIPSEFDAGIHQLDAHGQIVGGLAPQLRKVGAEEPKMAPGIDPNEAARNAAAAEEKALAEKVKREASLVAEVVKQTIGGAKPPKG